MIFIIFMIGEIMRDDYKDDCHKMGPGRQAAAAVKRERGRYFRLIHRG